MAGHILHDGVALTGVLTLRAIDPETGAVLKERTVENSLVDDGRNKLLRLIGDITENATREFSGDGSTTVFTLDHPYKPIDNVVDVSVGGTSQTEHTNYSVDYAEGKIHFNNAPADGTNNISVEVDYLPHSWRWLAVGDDDSSHSDSQSSLQNETKRVDLDSDYSLDTGATEATGTWTIPSSFSGTIKEAAIVNSPPSAPSNSGTMFNRVVVSPAFDAPSGTPVTADWVFTVT